MRLSLWKAACISTTTNLDRNRGTWDDDDWFSNRRLEMQLNYAEDNYKDACVLVNWFMYDMLRSKSYYSYTRPWEGSIFCRKSIVAGSMKYPRLSKGEDTGFVIKLIERNCLYPAIDPSLYIYIYHGKNTWDGEHFGRHFHSSQQLCNSTNELFRRVVEGGLPYDEASRLIKSRGVLKEINYFSAYKGRASE